MDANHIVYKLMIFNWETGKWDNGDTSGTTDKLVFERLLSRVKAGERDPREDSYALFPVPAMPVQARRLNPLQ